MLINLYISIKKHFNLKWWFNTDKFFIKTENEYLSNLKPVREWKRAKCFFKKILVKLEDKKCVHIAQK